MTRVHLFVDYQNVHLSAASCFEADTTKRHHSLIHPGLYGDRLMEKRAAAGRHGSLEHIWVYRGRPGMVQQPDAAARNNAQEAEWHRDRRVTVSARPLKYPSNWPTSPQQEKGIDVALAIGFVRTAIQQRADVLILASRDTDIVPALEMAVDLGRTDVEVVTWLGKSRLRLPGHITYTMPYTVLDRDDYLASRDPKHYS
jgi:uncharacterized LabA/DUF88 family protein